MSNIKKKLTLADKLKKARKDAGLSQKELGHVLLLSDKAVSSYEVGRAQPSLETLKQISKLTNRPVTYFVEESNTEDIDLQIRIKTIERELLEVKKLLQNKAAK
ncbi:MAG TPA: helix-turn-helix transcriptional regulator [Vitreimonas sp.]|nr:helix-turn-helix transcriptional regulator [Vitreimonas sp.]